MKATFLNGQYRSGTTFLFKSLIGNYDYGVYEPDSPNILTDSIDPSTTLHGFNPWKANTVSDVLVENYLKSPFINGEENNYNVKHYFLEIIKKLETKGFRNVLIQTNQCSDFLHLFTEFGTVYNLVRNIDDQYNSWKRTYLLSAKFDLFFLKKVFKPFFIKRHLWVSRQLKRYYAFLGITSFNYIDHKTMFLEYYILGNYISSLSDTRAIFCQSTLNNLANDKCISFKFSTVDILDSKLYNRYNKSNLNLYYYANELKSFYERNS